MLHEWSNLVAPAVQDRLCLLLNHVIGREPTAMARLAPYAGRAVVVHLKGWPSLLPPAPDLVLGVTRAGLWERLEGVPGDGLRLEIDASNPALAALNALAGERPKVAVQGDAALAGEIVWLIDHLRWDIEDDLAQLLGPAPAHQLASWSRAGAQALAGLVRMAVPARSAGQSGRTRP